MRIFEGANRPVLYDAKNRPIPLRKLKSVVASNQARAFLAGFKGANDVNLADWAFEPLDINTILRNDLRRLRARSRDLARNDDTAKRFLSLLKQNVIGHAGIILQAKNKLADNKTLDAELNGIIEREWNLFSAKRRYRGGFVSPSACGQLSMLEMAWLATWCRAIDGECFIQLLPGYPHNRHRLAMRFLNPDLLDHTYSTKQPNGNRVEMGIEFDEFGRPITYHFSKTDKDAARKNANAKRLPIPASQILHIFRREYVGQIRGIPDFATIMHKQKMLNGVHEAIVVGWRVAAAKMGFFTSEDPVNDMDDDEEREPFDARTIDATPGSFDMVPYGVKLETFDPDYPTSTYESGNKVFMQQLSNGLNVSSPTLSNDYSKVNYSSLRQALLEDREGWRCIQREMIDGFYYPVFDEWYEWTTTITGRIDTEVSEPVVVWHPRGWPWVDPEKEVNAHLKAVAGKLRTRQSIMAETSGADFQETVESLAEEEMILEEHGLTTDVPEASKPDSQQTSREEEDDE